MSEDYNPFDEAEVARRASESINDGGPAFECMTLRDYFAASALQGMLAYSLLNPQTGNYHENSTPEDVADIAYFYARAMLKARDEREND